MLALLYEAMDNPESTIGAMLTGGSSGTVGEPASSAAAIGEILKFIPLLGEFTGNRRYSDALYRQAERVAEQYQDQAVKGKATQGFADFFQDNYLRGR
jgi:hypothetical protein